jgi:hypothetical protein
VCEDLWNLRAYGTSVFVELVSLCSNVCAHSFIGSRGARTLSGVSTGGPGDILNNVHIGALNATDSEIFLFGPRAYPLPGYGHVSSR